MSNFTSSFFDTMDFDDDEPKGESVDGLSLLIAYATESGNSRECAEFAERKAAKLGFKTTIVDLANAKPADLEGHERALFVVSTRSDDENPADAKDSRPPLNSIPFWNALKETPAGSLAAMRFSVLSLGDSSYKQFCWFGKQLDAQLEQLGAKRFHDRVDCDKDYGANMRQWVDATLEKLTAMGASAR